MSEYIKDQKEKFLLTILGFIQCALPAYSGNAFNYFIPAEREDYSIVLDSCQQIPEYSQGDAIARSSGYILYRSAATCTGEFGEGGCTTYFINLYSEPACALAIATMGHANVVDFGIDPQSLSQERGLLASDSSFMITSPSGNLTVHVFPRFFEIVLPK